MLSRVLPNEGYGVHLQIYPEKNKINIFSTEILKKSFFIKNKRFKKVLQKNKKVKKVSPSKKRLKRFSVDSL